ncbi:unnamed protein product, partial [Prorocentrum cordatum]
AVNAVNLNDKLRNARGKLSTITNKLQSAEEAAAKAREFAENARAEKETADLHILELEEKLRQAVIPTVTVGADGKPSVHSPIPGFEATVQQFDAAIK